MAGSSPAMTLNKIELLVENEGRRYCAATSCSRTSIPDASVCFCA